VVRSLCPVIAGLISNLLRYCGGLWLGGRNDSRRLNKYKQENSSLTKNTNISVTLLTVTIICISVCISIISWPFMEGRYNDLLYIAPKTAEMRELNGVKLEELNGDTVIISYEILSNARVGAINANYDCILIKTNYTYNYLFNNPIVSGGFFAKDAQELDRKVAVLNLTAANTLFGNSNIYGKSITVNKIGYAVVGVINDGADDKNHVYTPVIYTSDQDNTPTPSSKDNAGKKPPSNQNTSVTGPIFIMASVTNTTLDHVKNELKAANISDAAYYFAPVGVLAGLVGKTPINTLKIIAIILLIIIILELLRIFMNHFRVLRLKIGEAYFSHILRHNPGVILRFLCVLIILFASICSVLYVINSLLPDILSWMDMDELMTFQFYTDCAGVIEQVRTAAILTLTGFGGIILTGISLIMTTLFTIGHKKRQV